MRLNWAASARRRAKLGKQLARQQPPLDKQTSSGRRERGWRGSGGRGREEGRPPGPRGCREPLAAGREEPLGAGLLRPPSEWGPGRGLRARSQEAWTRVVEKRVVRCEPGPQGRLSARKRWRNKWGAEERGRSERGKGAPGRGLRRGRGGRRAVTERKGKSDGGTREGRREEPGEEELEKSQGEGWEMTGM